MSQLPDFVRDAAADDFSVDDERAWLDTLARLPDALEPSDTSKLWAGLEQRVAQGPLRYAPFYDRLGELFALDDTGLTGELERSQGRAGWTLTPFAGVRLFRVRTGPTLGREGYLVHLAETARIPSHRHPAEEVTLVLEGGFVDDAGREAHAGDLIREAGSPASHSLKVIGGEPCVIALQLEQRFVFDSPIYRAILALFWR